MTPQLRRMNVCMAQKMMMMINNNTYGSCYVRPERWYVDKYPPVPYSTVPVQRVHAGCTARQLRQYYQQLLCSDDGLCAYHFGLYRHQNERLACLNHGQSESMYFSGKIVEFVLLVPYYEDSSHEEREKCHYDDHITGKNVRSKIAGNKFTT